jgi:glucose-1-phosphate adenylyltransferase
MNLLTIILAGGKGERLYPLTRDRAKPAVPFGGIYRIIDFTLSNCVHSSLKKILILTQYRSFSLERHIQTGWDLLCDKLGEFICVVPAQQRIDDVWYLGTADAVYQNLYILQQFRPDITLILSGDHVYKMDYRDLLDFHVTKGAELTIASVPQPVEEGHRFGVLEVDEENRILSFEEKPSTPKPLARDPSRVLASMGIYVFDTVKMVQYLIEDAKSDSQHDFGHNIIPHMIAEKELVYAYVFEDPQTRSPCYWRDIGTIESYWEAHMDLLGEEPVFDLYDESWPILTREPQAPPSRLMAQKDSGIRGLVRDAIISNGCILDPELLVRTIISPGVRIGTGAQVEESIIMEGVQVGEGACIRRAIVDKGNKIPPGMRIGFDHQEDSKHFTVTETGLVVVPKNSILE